MTDTVADPGPTADPPRRVDAGPPGTADTRPQPGGGRATPGPLDGLDQPTRELDRTAQLDRTRELDRTRDRALVEQTLRGDLEAFDRLVELHQDYLYGMVVRLLRDREAAADAVQEAFLSAYRNLSRFRGDSFRSWLTRIGLNAATDMLRASGRRPVTHYPELEDDSWQPPADTAEGPEHVAVARSRSRALSAALARITPDQRAAIVLFDVEGYDYQEIADITGVSLGTVKSRIHRGRLALRELLADDMELLRD